MNSSSERLVPIQFGTSGHRGMFGTGFVPEHVSALCRALGDFFAELGVARPKIALGYDTRRGNDPAFGPGSLTALAAEMLAKAGIEVISFHEYTPTPFISWAIPAFKLDGGLILTASHNPPQYGGMKFNPGNGAPADSTITDRLAELANLWLCNGGASGDSEDSLAGSFEPAGLSSCACGPAGQPGPDLPFRQLGPAVPSLSLLTLERPTRVQTGDFCWMEVPSHFSRVRERGFRHVWFLWEGWMNCLSLPFSDTLCRVKETRPLYELDPEARRAEVAQAFSCSADLTGKTVILADDILTTGATLSEIAAVLRGRGAARVYGICICRA